MAHAPRIGPATCATATAWPMCSGRRSERGAHVTDARPAVLEDLNRLMAEEIEAFLRYFQMRFRLKGQGHQAAEKFFEEALKETLAHAEGLARQIQSLGHVPTLRIQLSLGGDRLRPSEA